MLTTEVLVVGGGLGGLATAAALRHIAGMDNVTVLEAREDDDPRSNETAGAAIQLGPNALAALKAIGGSDLVDSVYEHSSELVETIMLLPGGAQMSVPNTAKEDTGHPVVLIRWGVLRKLLCELLPPESLLLGKGSDIAGYAVDDDENAVRPVNKNGEAIEAGSSSFSPQLIVAADGIHSVFRDRIQTGTRLPEDAAPQSSTTTLKDNGRVNIKAVVRASLGELGETFADNPGASYGQFDPQLAAFAGPAGPGHVYWAIAVADDPDSGTGFLDGVQDKVAAQTRVLEKLRASEAVDRGWIQTLVERTDPRALRIDRSLEATVKPEDSFVSADGRVVLVGDAAHAMNPAYGQSASFAFEDAATLALLLKDAADDTAEALRAYSHRRIGRCIEVQRRSEERARKAMKGEPTEDVSKWIYSWVPEETKNESS